jgi:NTP pyrophosphatase (non-canonical NTP hydrolase)
MPKGFLEILDIARDNIRRNPSLVGRTGVDLGQQYLSGLRDEVEEVAVEVKENNAVYLEDELSDIAWDYACVLAALEQKGLIESAEAVLAHSLEKYSQRAPAFLEASEDQWEAVKTIQKEGLKKRHEQLYGN